MIAGFPLFPLWMFFSLELCLLTLYHNLSSDSDRVLNLCTVVSLLIMLQEMWLQRLFLWLTGLPTQILCSATQDEQGAKSLRSISGHVFVSVLCCQLLHADGNPTFLRYKKLTFPYGMLWCYGSCATSFKYYMLCSAYSVASAMTSETPERYERLTSVSSSVDMDQRDTVSMPKRSNLKM